MPARSEWRKVFLTALKRTANLRAAAAAAGVSREAVRKARQRVPTFDRAVEDALEQGTYNMVDSLESALYLRALHSSDRAAIFMLTHLAPTKYGQHLAVDITGELELLASTTGLDMADIEQRAQRIADETKTGRPRR